MIFQHFNNKKTFIMKLTNTLNMSLFNGTFDTNPHEVNITQVFDIITGNSLKNDTERHRALKAIGQDDPSIKKRMAAVTPAVICRGGHGSGKIIAHTGMSLCDFDHVASPQECMAKLRADPHVLGAYITISGHGIRVFFRYEIEGTPLDKMTQKAYVRAFSYGNQYFARLLGAPFDEQCKNRNRLSIICHDPEAWFNPGAVPFCLPAEKPAVPAKAKNKPAQPQTMTIDEAERIIEEILAHTGIVYAEGGRNKYIMQAGYMLNKMGIAQGDAEQWAVARFADYGEKDTLGVIRSCYKNTAEHGTWQQDDKRKQRGRPRKDTTLRDVRSNHGDTPRLRKATAAEKEDFIKQHADVRHNTITRRTEIKWHDEELFRCITDRDENTLWMMMDNSGIATSPKEVHNIIASNHTPGANPFACYFNTLKPWDGTTDHIARLASHVHIACPKQCSREVAQKRFTKMFRMWMTGMVASLLSDKAINHEILTLIGKQGIYKSTFFEMLLPPQLRSYFNERSNNNMTDKDSVLAIAQYAIICLSEIDCMSTKELGSLKALITMASTNERAPYERYPEERPHIASFCATGNKREFLSDDTGNRRWMIFEVDAIDNPREIDYNYEGIYAQALHHWKKGDRYWMNEKEISEMEELNGDFETPDITGDLIQKYYRLPQDGETAELVSAGELAERITCNYRGKINTTKIGIMMRKLDVEKVRQNNRTYYKLISLAPEEYNSKRYDDTPDDTPF